MERTDRPTGLVGPPPGPDAEALRRAAVRWNQAQRLEREGQLAEAAAAYREAVDLDPSDADAFVRLGLLLRELGREPEAHDAFEAALSLREPPRRRR